MQDKLLSYFMRLGIFLLRGGGWAAIGIFVGFVVSYFFRLPGRVDTFAFAETMLGTIITGLSIVGAFMVVLQWGNLDRRIHEFEITVKTTNDTYRQSAEKAEKTAHEVDAFIQGKVTYLDDYIKDQITYLQQLLEGNARVATDLNIKIEEYKKFYVDLSQQNHDQLVVKERELAKTQQELQKMIEELRMLIDKTTDAQA